MGWGILGFVFSPFTAPVVHSALWGVVFCLDIGPFLFLLLFPCRMFFKKKKEKKKNNPNNGIAISTSPIAPNSKCNNSYHIIRSCCCIVVDMIGPTTKLLWSSQVEEASGECHSSFYNQIGSSVFSLAISSFFQAENYDSDTNKQRIFCEKDGP